VEEVRATAAERAAEIERLRLERLAAEAEARRMQATLDSLSQKNAILAEAVEGNLCCICLVEPKTHMLEPCKHICLCQDCAMMALKICPICRVPITSLARVY
jgi:hypothetical protein